jgi:hypothetical protein
MQDSARYYIGGMKCMQDLTAALLFNDAEAFTQGRNLPQNL